MLGDWLPLVTGSGPTADKSTVTVAPPDDPDRVSAQLVFGCLTVATPTRRLRRRGAEFLTPPVDRGYEGRAFFRDPDGHLFEISQVAG